MKTDSTDRARQEPWFPSDQQEQLRDFWVVYDRHFEALQEATLRVAERHAEFGPILRAMSPDQLAAQQANSRDLLQRAMQGEWRPYEDNLRQQGAAYAGMGLTFSAWYDIVTAFSADLVPRLVEAYCAEPARLTGALVALGAFLDRVMSTIADQYLDTKRELIREAEARHSQILEASLDPVISMDDRGNITEFNAAAEKSFGHARSDVLGKPLAEVVIPERFRRGHTDGLAKYLARGEGPLIGRRIELTALRADGSELPVELVLVALKLGDGHRQFTGFIRDLTDRRKAEQSLMLWAHVFEQAHFGIVISENDTGGIHSVNDAYAKMLGYTPDRIIGRPGVDFVAPEARADVPRVVQRIQERGHDTFEMTLVRKDGTTVPVLVASSTLPTRPDEPPLRIATVVDMTERKELERACAESAELLARNRRAEEASRLKSEFLANMSHELRTPLNSIIGFAELLYDGEVGAVAAKQREFLGDILASGKHLLQLINDVLDLAKVEAGKLEFHPEPIDLRRVIAEVLSILRTPAASKQIQVEASVADGIGEILLDASRLKQVLYNYVSNALKFTLEGGRVMVRVAADGPSSLRIEVEDTGIGIAASDMGRLFNEFQQLDSSAAKTHGGTGLGLALTKRLVEAQGGGVGATSELGKGSLFFAVLPRRGEGRPRVAWSNEAPAATAGAPPILIVEDDPRDQARIAQTLSAAGYAIDVVSTGADAVAKCRAREYRAVTLDLLLPDMSGLDVLRAVRDTGKNPAIPVVVLTVVAERVTAGFAISDVLAKPVDAEALLKSLQRAGAGPAPSSVVLVVDDDPGSLKLMAAVLEQLGFQPSCHADGRRALDSIDAERPVAIVLDLLMPGFDGFQFLARLRGSPAGATIPVVVWTMKDLSSAEIDLLRASASAVVAKGAGAVELTATLRACLGEPATGGTHAG
jgi:PAS domain S-box-containing protein